VKLSVITHTCREDVPRLPAPVLQMMVDSMTRQDYQGDFELIIVDLLWERRHKQFEEMWHGVGRTKSGVLFPILHIPDKQSPFKERNLLRISTPKNTGLMFARGDYVVFSDDCQEIPANTLSLIGEWAKLGCGVTFPYERKFRQTIDQPFHSRGIDGRIQSLETPLGSSRVVGIRDVSYIGASVSMLPMSVLESVNGWDEMFDGSRQLEDSDLVVRIGWSNLIMMAYDCRAMIIEYECGAGGGYGDVVGNPSVKCNPAYGQYVWGLGKIKANDLSKKNVAEAIHRMQWKNCLRLHTDKELCVPHMSKCYRYDDASGSNMLKDIYTDPRLRFNLAEIRGRCSWENALAILGVPC
jgi:hypothetical protein